MDIENKLTALLNEVCNIAITGELQLPILSGSYDSRYIDSGEVYDQSTIINVLINEIEPRSYLTKIEKKTSECLNYLRLKIDSELILNRKNRLIRDYLKLIDDGLVYLKGRSPRIKISNVEDVKKMRQAKFDELQKNTFNYIIETLANKSLIFLNGEMLAELGDTDRNTTQNIKPLQQSKQKEPTEFSEMFYRLENVELSIDILRKLLPPVIDSDYNYIGNNKGVVTGWIKCLKESGLIKKQPARVYTLLLNARFGNLKLGGSEFTHPYKSAEENLQEIRSKISKFP